MREILDHTTGSAADLPWIWIVLAAVTAAACREIIRLIGFLAGLNVVLRDTTGPDRIKVIEAYGRCVAAANQVDTGGRILRSVVRSVRATNR